MGNISSQIGGYKKVPFGIDCSPESMNLQENLISHWNLDDDLTGSGVDSFGTNHLLAQNLSAKQNEVIVSPTGTSFHMGASNSKCRTQAGETGIKGSGDFSYSFWFNPSGTVFLTERYVTYAEIPSWGIEAGFFNNQTSFFTHNTAGTKFTVTEDSPGVLTNGFPYFITVTHDNTAGSGTLYINGSGLKEASTTTDRREGAGTQLLYIGNKFESNLNRPGTYDHISFWDDRVLTPEEVVILYNNGSGLLLEDYEGDPCNKKYNAFLKTIEHTSGEVNAFIRPIQDDQKVNAFIQGFDDSNLSVDAIIQFDNGDINSQINVFLNSSGINQEINALMKSDVINQSINAFMSPQAVFEQINAFEGGIQKTSGNINVFIPQNSGISPQINAYIQNIFQTDMINAFMPKIDSISGNINAFLARPEDINNSVNAFIKDIRVSGDINAFISASGSGQFNIQAFMSADVINESINAGFFPPSNGGVLTETINAFIRPIQNDQKINAFISRPSGKISQVNAVISGHGLNPEQINAFIQGAETISGNINAFMVGPIGETGSIRGLLYSNMSIEDIRAILYGFGG